MPTPAPDPLTSSAPGSGGRSPSGSGKDREGAAAPSRTRRLALAAATIGVSLVVLTVVLAGAEIVFRMLRPVPPPGALVLSTDLGWDRMPPHEKPIPATAPVEPGRAPLRILFMGDSFTHNTAWSRLVVEALNRRGIAATGWEAGVSGYGQVQEALKLERLLPELKPDLTVLLFYAWNDPRDNCATPGIIYNPDMMGRPSLAEDGRVVLPSSFWMEVRGSELFRRLLEGWWYGRTMYASRRAMRDGGPDAVAASGEVCTTIFSDPLTWMPLYQPGAQEGAYMRSAWGATERALRRAAEACRAAGSGLVVAGIDSPITIDADVFDAHVRTSPLYRAEDFDTGLPLRRFEALTERLGLPTARPAPALAAYAQRVARKIYDGGPGNITGHLLPDAQEAMAEVIADEVQAWLRAQHP